jgi:hypothetical protein
MAAASHQMRLEEQTPRLKATTASTLIAQGETARRRAKLRR